MPQKNCVEDPQLQEIMDVLQHLGFEHVVEDKTYPRDLSQRGRIRVVLKDPITNEPINAEIPTRKELLRKLGSMIPNLKARKESGGKPKLPALPPGYVAMGPGAGVEAPASPAAPLPQSSPAAGGSGNRQSGGNSKKKGKR